MARMSPYRSGAPRFGSKEHIFDNSVKEYKLSSEELEQYFSKPRTIPVKSIDQKGDEEVAEGVKKQKQKVIAYAKYEELLSENEMLKKQIESGQAPANADEIDKLKQEVIFAHKLVSEKEEKIEKLTKNLDAVLSDKEDLINENTLLQNQVYEFKEVLQKTQKRCEFYQNAYQALEEELKTYKRVVFISLQKEEQEGVRN